MGALRSLAAGAALLLAACAPPPSGPPNVVLVVIDTLRADHLPFYGYPKPTAPFLSELAGRGVVFDNAWSTSSWTAPAAASTFTSLYPFQHGVTSGFRAEQDLQAADATIEVNRIPDAIVTLPEVLKAAGYATFGVADNLNISREEGFEQGFDRLVTFNYETAERVNEQVLAWADELASARPYFLYVHYMDPHWEYRPREPWFDASGSNFEQLVSAYDSEIAWVDGKIEELFERFDWDRNTLVIVTADHGEEFNEHGAYGHGHTLYGEVLRVPLLVYYPAGGVAPARVATDVSLLDILPTVRAGLGLPADEGDEGVSLLDPTGGRTLLGHLWKKNGTPDVADDLLVRSVLSPQRKYIWTFPDREEVYDRATDAAERHNRAADHAEFAAASRDAYLAFEARSQRYRAERQTLPMSAAQLEKLRALGYVE